MEAVKKSIEDMSKLFSMRMAEFQRELESSTSGSSSSPVKSKISQEFNSFQNFVIFAIQNLQAQVQTLSNQMDELEMRSRRKMLLIHKLPEEHNEDTPILLHKLITEQLGMSLSTDCFTRCHRMGRYEEHKPRPVLVKFKDISLRDNVWHNKTKLKGSGTTISEFLTKIRHELFITARQRYGISKCWTKSGKIYIMGSDGSRHCVASAVDLDTIPGSTANPPSSTAAVQHKSGISATKAQTNITSVRPRRPIKK